MKTCPQCNTGYPDSHTTCPTHGLLLNEIRDLKPGMIIRNTYRIVRKLGQGGMGAVYLAQHTLMNEPQALKFLSSELSQDEAFTSRFLREVRTLRQIRHKNVIDAGNLEPAEDGTLFFSMEFVDGPDLRRFLHDAPKPFDVSLALNIARQIAEGLGAAHAKGMVHRDIKPENILMVRDGDTWLAKIADFGIVATKESSTVYTRTGGTLLTMAYAAPEQWRGTPAAELDGRTDLYALGGLLYEMLTGRTAFRAENYESWARQHQTTPPQPPSTLRPDLANWQGLDALVLRLLAKDREQRPRHVTELLGLLDAVKSVPREVHQDTAIDRPAASLGQKTAGGKPKSTLHRSILIGLFACGMVLAAFAMWFGLNRFPMQVNPTVHAPITEQQRTLQIQPEQTQTAQANPQQIQPTQSQPEQFAGLKPPGPKPNGLQETKPASESNSTPSAPTVEIHQAPKPTQVESIKPTAQQNSLGEADKQANILVGQHRYAEAAPLYDQACNGGIATDCFILGRMYRNGDGVSRNQFRAVTLLSKACDAGIADSCAGGGYMYLMGEGVPKDQQKAAAMLSKGCEMGSMDSCFASGITYENGIGVEKSLPRAVVLYSRACDAGQNPACGNLGDMYLNGRGVTKDYSRAANLLTKGCEAGNIIGCYNLGLLYELGNGVSKDTSRAAALFLKACDAGNAMACGNLGHAYANGDGVTKDLLRAATSYSKACDGGIAMSCGALGGLYQQGNGVAKDFNQAQTLYSKACNGGYALGCAGLGYIYLNGNGVAKDDPKAAEFFTKACDAGEVNACVSLGIMYQYGGKGVGKDKDKAKNLYNKACSKGSQQACDLLKKLH
ncbi:MAG TPA: protein kinase [Terracidiphilus sp.]